MENNYTIEIDPLAVGLTRPPMFAGVNMRLFFANLMLSFLICIDTHSFYGILVFIILHMLMFRLSIKEANFFKLYVTDFQQTPPTLNSWFWKVNSYEPW